MNEPNWRNLDLHKGLLREAVPQDRGIVVWLPSAAVNGVRRWERVSTCRLRRISGAKVGRNRCRNSCVAGSENGGEGAGHAESGTGSPGPAEACQGGSGPLGKSQIRSSFIYPGKGTWPLAILGLRLVPRLDAAARPYGPTR